MCVCVYLFFFVFLLRSTSLTSWPLNRHRRCGQRECFAFASTQRASHPTSEKDASRCGPERALCFCDSSRKNEKLSLSSSSLDDGVRSIGTRIVLAGLSLHPGLSRAFERAFDPCALPLLLPPPPPPLLLLLLLRPLLLLC